MEVYAQTNRKLFVKRDDRAYATVQVRSKSNPNKFYTVDMDHGRCSCPAWKFQRGGYRKPCKHLKSLGFKELP